VKVSPGENVEPSGTVTSLMNIARSQYETGVKVGGIGVFVGGTTIAVGGSGVAVAGIAVGSLAVGVNLAWIVASELTGWV